MKYSLALILIALTLTSQSAFANCGSQSLFQKVIFYKTAADCGFLADILKPIEKAYQFFNKQVNISLFIQDRGTNASFDNGQVIWLPKNLYAYDDRSNAYYASRKDLSPILLHEIGHAFLHERLKKDLNAELGELFSKLQSISDSTLRTAQANGRSSNSGLRANSYLADTVEFKKYLKFVVSYTELYADAVSVLYYNDPDVMFKSLRFSTHNSFEKPYIQARSFSQDHSFSSIQNALKVHTEFSYVRSFLGKEMKRMTSKAQRVFLLQALEDAIALQIQEEISIDELPDLVERNLNLVRKIEMNLKTGR